MSDHIYKKSEIVGSSAVSVEDAIQGAIAKASQTVKHIEWFEVSEVRGHVVDGKVGHYQVVLKIGFRLD
ncbi:MAG: dodecin [bacterium]